MTQRRLNKPNRPELIWFVARLRPRRESEWRVLARQSHLDKQHVLSWSWGLAVNRLLQIVDSTHPAHAPLVEQLRQFIDEARSDITG